MIAWPSLDFLKDILNLLNYHFKTADLYVLAAGFILMWLAILSDRKKTKKATTKEIEKYKNSKNGFNDLSIDFTSISSQLTAIHQFVMSAVEIGSKEGLAEALVDLALKITKSDAGCVLLFEPSKVELVTAASRGLGEDAVKTIKANLAHTIAGSQTRAGNPIFLDASGKKAVSTGLESAEKCSPGQITAIPLKVRDKLIGFISAVCPNDINKFESKDLVLLSMLADQTALLFENLGLYDNIQGFYFEIIQALARTIDAKDSYTHDHADRARKYARLICRKLKLPAKEIVDIEYAAMVHDIGKIGIKEEILHKAAKLNPEEEEALRHHPQIGNRILEPVAFLASVAPIVLYHHEWYNGEGYPDGLKGEKIPLGSRIVSVIDAYDAMTSDRPYRKAFSRQDAVKELVEGKGIQFDPNVVDAFLEVLKEENHI